MLMRPRGWFALLVAGGCGHGFFDPLPDCRSAAADGAPDVAPSTVAYVQSNY